MDSGPSLIVKKELSKLSSNFTIEVTLNQIDCEKVQIIQMSKEDLDAFLIEKYGLAM